MRKTLVIFGLLVAVPMFGQWHASRRLTRTDSTSTTSQTGGMGIVADSENVYIVWFDETFLSSTVRYNRFPIGGFMSLGSGWAMNSDGGYGPVVAVSDSNVHFDWSSGSLWFREIVGLGLNPTEEHGWPGRSNFCPAIADDSFGNTHCVFNYQDETRGYCLAYQCRAAGGGFSAPLEIIGPPEGLHGYSQYYPTICIAPDNRIHMAWFQPWTGNIGYATSPDGVSWVVSEIPNTYGASYNNAPSICCDAYNTVYVAYIGPQEDAYAVTKSGKSWNGPTNLSKGSICGSPSICVDYFGSVWVAWHAHIDDEPNEIYYKQGLAFLPAPQQLTSSDSYRSEYPDMTADLKGNVHLVWTDSSDGNYEIYYNWCNGEEGEGRDLAVTCVMQPDGRIHKETIMPIVRVANFGEKKDSCYVNCTITGPSSTYNENNKLGTVVIASGGEMLVAFPDWTPPGSAGDKYEVKATLYILPERSTKDDNPANNVFIDSCVIRGVAITATTILEPQEGDTVEKMAPKAYFTNTGTEPAANFYCHCDITSSGFQNESYADSVLVADSLAVGDSIFFAFTEWRCNEECSHIATFHATSATEDTIYSPHVEVPFFSPPPGVSESPEVFRLELLGSNPFSAPPAISYSVNPPTKVSIRVYDVIGKLVRTVHDGDLSGKGVLSWDGKDDSGRALSRGLYFVRILAPQFNRTAKVILVR